MAWREGTVEGDAAPMLGWRLWRLHEGALRSWAVSYDWSPGRNLARCIGPGVSRCQDSPGPGCHCGFWGLYDPVDCLMRGRYQGLGWWPVVGLMRGWGAVALHGEEGFRSQQAAVACLFTDWPYLRRPVRRIPSRPSLWQRGLALLETGEPLAERSVGRR